MIIQEGDMTPWFPPHRKPVREGVYKVKWSSYLNKNIVEEGYAYFDGKLWGWTTSFLDRALQEGSEGARQEKHWRGLTPAAWGRLMAERIK